MTGPVEYVILQFPRNHFDGKITAALADLVRNGTIRVLDLVFVMKDERGDVQAYEYDALDQLDTAFDDLDGEVGGLISAEDIEYVGSQLDAESSVALLVWEDLWAASLLEALQEAGGALVEGARIPHDLIEPALAGLVSAE